MTTMNMYSKEQTDLALADKQDTLVSGTNIKTVNGGSVVGSGNLGVAGTWEKLDRTRLPSDFAANDVLLINVTAGRTASVTPASWATAPTGTVSVTSGGSHSAIVIRLTNNAATVDLPVSLTIVGLSCLGVTMPSVGGANEWNNADTSTYLFSLQACQFNGGGSIRSDLTRVTKSNLTDYTNSIYRLRKRYALSRPMGGGVQHRRRVGVLLGLPLRGRRILQGAQEGRPLAHQIRIHPHQLQARREIQRVGGLVARVLPRAGLGPQWQHERPREALGGVLPHEVLRLPAHRMDVHRIRSDAVNRGGIPSP